MFYHYHQLSDKTANRTSSTTTSLYHTIKNLELTMKDLKFFGEDPILILDFLSRLNEEADTLDMNEGQLWFVFPAC